MADTSEDLRLLNDFCEKCADVPVTYGVLKHLVAFVDDMNERNKERNVKIAALEASNQTLRDRILELEAQKAIADVKR